MRLSAPSLHIFVSSASESPGPSLLCPLALCPLAPRLLSLSLWVLCSYVLFLYVPLVYASVFFASAARADFGAVLSQPLGLYGLVSSVCRNITM